MADDIYSVKWFEGEQMPSEMYTTVASSTDKESDNSDSEDEGYDSSSDATELEDE